MLNRDSIYTIREINLIAKREELSKVLQSYSTVYGLVRSGRVPVVKLGNRYLLRICDIEKALSADVMPVASGIRRID